MGLDVIDTPALVVDLDAFERNLGRMAAAAKAAGVRLRPHAKTHKSPVIARRQIALGAVGVCCQKVSEAEILVDGGVDDVLVSNQVAGARKLERLAALARRARVGVCVDDAGNARDVSAAAVRFGAEIDVLVEIDVGAGRCGVAPGEDAVALAAEVAALPGLRFAGLQAYHGSAQHLRGADERRAAIGRAGEMTRRTVAMLAEAGLACATVGGAGTGTYQVRVFLGDEPSGGRPRGAGCRAEGAGLRQRAAGGVSARRGAIRRRFGRAWAAGAGRQQHAPGDRRQGFTGAGTLRPDG
jgi:D-serine deaminase-like pyridoxal phosphate-dependent protein